MTKSDECRPVYCVAGPCAPSCLRMDDPEPIQMPPDRIAYTAARIRAARKGLSDDQMPDIPIRRAVELYEGRSTPTARELGLYAEACGVSVDWLLTGATSPNGEGAPVSVVNVQPEDAPTHVCPPGHLYACPTALEVESSCHGGRDVCCDRPDLHVPLPDGPATDALSVALSEAAKKRFAAQKVADDAWGTVWLHGKWRYLTKCMTTPEREHAADCVARWMVSIDAADGEPTRTEPEELRWWRDDR